jgi:twitching motility protein PilT
VGQSKFGMQTMNQSLYMLYQKKLITLDEALGRSSDVDELRNMMASGSLIPQQPADFRQAARMATRQGGSGGD